MQKNKDREPITIGVGVALSAGSIVFKGIFGLARQIHQTVQDYGSNRKDCVDLDEHVYEVESYLQYLQTDTLFHEQFQEPIMNLEACLIDCLEFLQEFTNASVIEQIIHTRRNKRKFEELNKQLVNCKERLLFAIGIHKITVNGQGEQPITTLDFDGKRRRPHADQSRHKPMTPSNNHGMKQFSAGSPHQKRHVPHQNTPQPHKRVHHPNSPHPDKRVHHSNRPY